MSPRMLNVGCGSDIRKGWINLDAVALAGVDVVHDIETVPLPFDDDQFDLILCKDIIEHVDYIPVLRELHRILKTGGSLHIRVPHFTSWRNFEDPTHKKMFSIRTFDYFAKNTRAERDYYFDFQFDRIASSKIMFEKGVYFYNHVVEFVVNASRKMKETLYEATFLAALFPAQSIIIKLVK